MGCRVFRGRTGRSFMYLCLGLLVVLASGCGQSSDDANASKSMLVATEDEPAGERCPRGGKRIVSGADTDQSGTLDEAEVDQTSIVCHGDSTRVETTDEPAGENCPNGGNRITTGIDTDGNGQLEDEEVEATTFVCHGEAASEALIETRDEPAGDNCPNGGKRVISGVDANTNGTLDEEEVDETTYLCHGQDGQDGEDGEDGQDGQDGEDGQDGSSALVETTDEPAGSHCPAGGLKIETGTDTDDDGVLSDGEIEATTYVCDGTNAVVEMSDEPVGANCTSGGIRIQTGIDDDGDDTLDDSEVSSEAYVCDGATTLAKTAPADVADCPSGGSTVSFGTDTNDDGTLQAGEVETTRQVCNGSSGLVTTSTVSLGHTECLAGGVKIQSGIDADGDGNLESSAGEIDQTRYVCNGQDGEDGKDGQDGEDGQDGKDGQDGATSLVKTSEVTSGSNECPAGGTKIETGVDDDEDGTLGATETDQTVFVCDGEKGDTGATALVETADVTSGCNGAGGTQITVGVDGDRSGYLDENEETHSAVICNGQQGPAGAPGEDGLDVLTKKRSIGPGTQCDNGGHAIDFGRDLNDDGVLASGEVTTTYYVCGGEEKPAVSVDMKQISAGGTHNCGISSHDAKKVTCWGSDVSGEVAGAPTTKALAQVSAGRRFNCGLKTDGSVYCWGNDSYGNASPPSSSDFTHISAGRYVACGVKSGGSVVCWGTDDYNQVSGVPTSKTFEQVSAGGGSHVCALASDGSIECWGESYPGAHIPPRTTDFTQVSAGAGHSCALKSDGSIECWGLDTVGDGQASPPPSTDFIQVSAGGHHTCGLKSDGSIVCWGDPNDGQSSPPATNDFTQITAGNDHTCGLRTDGSVACWGRNHEGQSETPW